MPPPGLLRRAARGIANAIRGPRTFAVRELRFQHNIDIWYARIPDSAAPNVGWLESRPFAYPGQPALAVATHITPAVVFPPAGNNPAGDPWPHYERTAHANSPGSLPVAFERDSGAAPAAGPRQVRVIFRCTSHAGFDGDRDIKADSAGGLTLGQQTVTFANGVGVATFTLTGCPNTVDRKVREVLRWYVSHAGEGEWTQFDQTDHTFYFVLQNPVQALGHAGAAPEQFYFEVFDWSCRWALATNAANTTSAAIWAQFTPIKAAHDTGLIYWRGQPAIDPAQNLADGIRSMDAVGLQQYAISCVVWDRIFCNCLAAHGIRSAEMVIVAHPEMPDANAFLAKYNGDPVYMGHVDAVVNANGPPPAGWPDVLYWLASQPLSGHVRTGLPPGYVFAHAATGAQYLNPDGWRIPNGNGHGNPGAPSSWNNHWIAAVFVGGVWSLHDPSYGVSMPWADPSAAATLVPPAAYETGVVTFRVVSRTTGNWVTVATANPGDPRLDAGRNYIN